MPQHGFDVGEQSLPGPRVRIEQDVRDRLMRVLCAVGRMATPEEISGWLAEGFPPEIEGALEAPLVREEMSDLVDVVLVVLRPALLMARKAG